MTSQISRATLPEGRFIRLATGWYRVATDGRAFARWAP
jgi:hypothetical protein